MSPNNPFLRSHDPAAPAVQGDHSVGQDLDNIFRLTAAQPGHQQAPARVQAGGAEPRRVTQPDLDAALDMLTRAAKAMDLMQGRYQQIEEYAKGVADRAEKDIAVAHAQVRDWEVRAAAADGKADEFRTRIAAAERRAETAERRVETAERRAEAAERNAKEARDWLECFYDKIVTSFDTRSLLKSQAA